MSKTNSSYVSKEKIESKEFEIKEENLEKIID